MNLSPDAVVYWQWGPIVINATLVYTWLTMALLVGGSWLVTRKLSTGAQLSRWQNILETIVELIRGQIRDVTQQAPDAYLPFAGTLFLFIAFANLLSIVPGFLPPTGSLSTTTALALCVFFAVPIFGIAQQGVRGYLKHYIEPSPLLLPFQIIGELSRTLALAVRLFGNVMSATLIVAILLTLAPLFFPIVLQGLGLLTGFIQAYIFAMLALVYIASATRVQQSALTVPPAPKGTD